MPSGLSRGVISGGAVEQDITRYEVLGALPGGTADEIKREYDAKIVAGKPREKEGLEELMSTEKSQQPVAYVISAVEGFEDEATVRRYAELAGPSIEHFGGRFLVSNAEPVVVEGESPLGHLSMVEFPSIEDAQAWYDSPEYADARALTPAAFRGRMLMFVEGVKSFPLKSRRDLQSFPAHLGFC
jgi:uncharacterized protein (DUF1330 family)